MRLTRKLFELATEVATLSSAERSFLIRAFARAPFEAAELRRRGLRGVVRSLGSRRFAPRGAPVDVARAERLVRAAFRYGPGRVAGPDDGRCLPESITQYALHLRTGPEPRLVIGVRRGDDGDGAGWLVSAHAWVEEEGGARRAPEFAPLFWISPRGVGGAMAGALE
jgi:hypothetical protein